MSYMMLVAPKKPKMAKLANFLAKEGISYATCSTAEELKLWTDARRQLEEEGAKEEDYGDEEEFEVIDSGCRIPEKPAIRKRTLVENGDDEEEEESVSLKKKRSMMKEEPADWREESDEPSEDGSLIIGANEVNRRSHSDGQNDDESPLANVLEDTPHLPKIKIRNGQASGSKKEQKCIDSDDSDEDMTLAEFVKTPTTANSSITCPVFKCGYDFPTGEELNDHMKKEHKRPLICRVCKHKFIYPSTILQHSRIHTGERPFECKQCSGKFTQKCHLVTHIKKMHQG